MAGTFSLQSNEAARVHNTCLLYNPDGLCTHRYDKIHLFDVQVGDEEKEVYNESDTIIPGNSTVVAETPLGRIGMTVCYDLRFPELYRELSRQQSEIITVPSAFTYATGKRHWELFLTRPGGGKPLFCHRLQPGRAEYGNQAHLGPQYDYRPLGRCIVQP